MQTGAPGAAEQVARVGSGQRAAAGPAQCGGGHQRQGEERQCMDSMGSSMDSSLDSSAPESSAVRVEERVERGRPAAA